MADTPIPRSKFGTSSLVERRNQIPPVELDVEDGPGAVVDVEGDAVIEAPGLTVEMEEDGGVVVDFDPRATAQGSGDFYSEVIHKTQGQLPFIFQPDNTENSFIIAKFDQNSFTLQQTAPNLYNAKCRVKECW